MNLAPARDIGWRQSSLDEVVDGVVSHMMTSGLATGEAMNTSTVDLHATDTRVWCTHCGTETQRDGICSEVSSSLVPTDEQGMTFRKLPEWGAATTISRARPAWFCAADSTSSYFWFTTGASHTFWTPALDRSGTAAPHLVCHSRQAAM